MTRPSGGGQWKKDNYRRLWATTLEMVSKDYPELSGMWLRDLRKAAISDMRRRGTDGAVASKIAGHSQEMSFHYTQATDPATREAILRLGA